MSACPEYPPTVATLVDVLAHQRATTPHRTVCHRIVRRRDGLAADPLGVAELGERAGRAANVLARVGVRDGDRVIVSLADPHDFLVAFFGAITARAIPVPLPTAGELGAPRSFAARVRSVCGDCAPAAAVVERTDAFARAVGTIPAGVACVEPRALADGEPQPLPSLPASTPAFVQYTSGSTGSPKGVVVTHANVLANCRAIRDATGYTRADRMVSWLPLHHDMGLVGGLLTSIYCAAETWLMPPTAFLARPVSWLEAMTAFAATLTVAPTFAYALCARKVPAKQLRAVDLSSVRLAYVGAEPVDGATLDAFVARFAAHGLRASAMYPVYGLAEATLAVAFPAPGAPPRCTTVHRGRLAAEGVAVAVDAGDPEAVTFVSVGRELPGHHVDVVSPDTGEPLADGRVGELVVAGPSVTPRYFADGPGVHRTRLATGDLGFRADDALYVVDRIKDLVIVAGQNYAPSDLEASAARVRGVRAGRVVAFAAPGDAGTEAVHVVAEASPRSWRLPDDVAEDVRRAVLRDVGLGVASVTIVAPGTLERTSSGKIRRRACAEAHRLGTLRTLRTRSDVLAARVAHRRRRELVRAAAARRAVVAWMGRVLPGASR